MSSKRGGKRGSARPKKRTEEDWRDEVDEFVDDRQDLAFNDDVNADPADNEDDFSGELDDAMDLSMSGERDSDEDSEEEEAAPVEDTRGEKWGSKKAYYARNEEDDVSFEDSEEENAIQEEEEVKRIQKKKAAERSEADFDTFASLVNRKSSVRPEKNLSSNDSSLLASMHRDLDAISLQKSSTKDADDEIERVTRDVTAMTKDEKLDIIRKDSPELFSLLDALKEKIVELREKISPLISRVKDGHLPTSKGLSYLEVKHQLLLNYCTNICFYLLLKAEGRSVKNHPVIEQLVRLRLLIDKLKPLDQKLKYQIDKLVKTATVGGSTTETDETLKHKPNLKAFGGQDEGSEDEEEEEAANGAKTGLYVAPKISATHLDRHDEKRKRQDAKRESRAKNSLMAQHIMEEYGDEPVEQPADLIAREADSGEETAREREAYEEETFQRMTVSKKDRKKRKRSALPNDLNELEDWADMVSISRHVTETAADEEEEEATKSKKSKLAALMNTIDQTTRKSAKGARGGDDDIPYYERHQAKKVKLSESAPAVQDRDHDFVDDAEDQFVSYKGKKRASEDFGGDSFDEDEAMNEFAANKFSAGVTAGADEMLEAAASRKQRKGETKQQRKEDYLETKLAQAKGEEVEGKRKINYQMEKNLGITKAGAKAAEKRNPRVKNREKFRKALIRRKGQVQSMRDQSQAYTGEATVLSSGIDGLRCQDNEKLFAEVSLTESATADGSEVPLTG